MTEKAEILKTRAKKLAKPIQTQDIMPDSIDVLVFQLAQEHYAIETHYVKEVYAYKDYTVLPSTPSFIFGLINVRRKILSILDLKVFFSLPVNTPPVQKVIIVEANDMEFAILTDGVIGIHQIPTDRIQSSLPTLSGVKQEFFERSHHR